MDEKTIQDIITKNQDKINEAVEKQIMDDITSTLTWSLRDGVSKVVQEFVAAEVAPKVKEHLALNKDNIIDSVCAEVPTIAEAISGAISTQIAKALSDGYKVKKLMSDLF